MTGFVYLIRCNDMFKIGISSDVGARISEMQTGNPYELVCESAYEYQNPLVVERALQQKFSSKVIRGEWYQLDSNDVNDFNEICSMLGGAISDRNTPTANDIIEAETMDDEDGVISINDLDRMLSDGWRIEIAREERYWILRRGSGNRREYKFGGRFNELPEEFKEAYFERKKARESLPVAA